MQETAAAPINNVSPVNKVSPVKKRHVILDAMRGLAILGIGMANFPEFSLYTFQPEEVVRSMPSAGVDNVVQWLMLVFVDGKFYTIFSLLFGIGFAIILKNARERGASGTRLFYRRMAGLAVIGLLHLMLLWSGDILLLYALMGMLLPLFMPLGNKAMRAWIVVLLALPVVWDAVFWAVGVNPAAWVYDRWWDAATARGIDSQNFGTWLRDAQSYGGVSAFLMQGAVERLWEFVDSSRYFKVLGLFVAGAYIGRNGLRPDTLRRWSRGCLAVGLPLSVLYAICGMGVVDVPRPVRSVVYMVSVYPMGFAYFTTVILVYLKCREARIWRVLAYPGRMALTCYIMQSVFGMLVFYGVGLGLGASFGLGESVLAAIAVFAVEVVLSRLWLGCFAYGPIEWIWRMWNYGRYLPIRRVGA